MNNKSQLRKEYEECKKKVESPFKLGKGAKRFLWFPALLFILGIIVPDSYVLIGASVMLVPIFFILRTLFQVSTFSPVDHAEATRKLEILGSGLEGEDKEQDLFSSLPDGYYVIPDLCISIDNKRSQIDHLIVGSTGVFIIETKNTKGIIEGREDDTCICQAKSIHPITRK